MRITHEPGDGTYSIGLSAAFLAVKGFQQPKVADASGNTLNTGFSDGILQYALVQAGSGPASADITVHENPVFALTGSCSMLVGNSDPYYTWTDDENGGGWARLFIQAKTLCWDWSLVPDSSTDADGNNIPSPMYYGVAAKAFDEANPDVGCGDGTTGNSQVKQTQGRIVCAWPEDHDLPLDVKVDLKAYSFGFTQDDYDSAGTMKFANCFAPQNEANWGFLVVVLEIAIHVAVHTVAEYCKAQWTSSGQGMAENWCYPPSDCPPNPGQLSSEALITTADPITVRTLGYVDVTVYDWQTYRDDTFDLLENKGIRTWAWSGTQSLKWDVYRAKGATMTYTADVSWILNLDTATRTDYHYRVDFSPGVKTSAVSFEAALGQTTFTVEPRLRSDAGAEGVDWQVPEDVCLASFVVWAAVDDVTHSIGFEGGDNPACSGGIALNNQAGPQETWLPFHVSDSTLPASEIVAEGGISADDVVAAGGSVLRALVREATTNTTLWGVDVVFTGSILDREYIGNFHAVANGKDEASGVVLPTRSASLPLVIVFKYIPL